MYQAVQSQRMAEHAGGTGDPRQRLLDAAVAHVAEHGVEGLTLRGLATAIGTSHRMLIYHFGSKQGLLVEVVRAVEAQQRDLLASFRVDPALSPAEVGRRMWAHLADPALWPSERLFFETYGQALQGRPHTATFLDEVVDAWLEPAAALRRAQGVPSGDAPALGRLDLAVTRGLLLDLLATGDRAGVDAALEQYLALDRKWAETPRDDTSPRDAVIAPFGRDAGSRIRVLLVSGSLRRGSTNTAVLRTVGEVAPPDVATARYPGLAELPPFNPDDDAGSMHPAVARLRAHIHAAHAVVFCVPEYAGGLPGTVKNLLDWTVGDDQPGSIYEKPVAWINASVRAAADAHASLRAVLGYAHANVVDTACAHIPVPASAVDEDGTIGDPAIRTVIRASLDRLIAVVDHAR
jgi:NAD(P)H-dependent FMN reductase/AcrR family transcriptional regulator